MGQINPTDLNHKVIAKSIKHFFHRDEILKCSPELSHSFPQHILKSQGRRLSENLKFFLQPSLSKEIKKIPLPDYVSKTKFFAFSLLMHTSILFLALNSDYLSFFTNEGESAYLVDLDFGFEEEPAKSFKKAKSDKKNLSSLATRQKELLPMFTKNMTVYHSAAPEVKTEELSTSSKITEKKKNYIEKKKLLKLKHLESRKSSDKTREGKLDSKKILEDVLKDIPNKPSVLDSQADFLNQKEGLFGNLNGKLRSQGGEYQRKISVLLHKSHSKFPGMEHLKKIATTVLFTVEANGDVTEVKITKSSGNSFYDDSIKRLLEQESPLPKPPLKKKKSFEITFHSQTAH
jgi:TonB family protein